MPRTVEFEIVQGDIAAFEADVVVLKYAQAFYGADWMVAHALRDDPKSSDLQPAVGEYRLIQTDGHVEATYALFVGVASLPTFRYEQIRGLASQALDILANEIPDTKHIAMTIHGVGFGLDEIEALQAQFFGCLEALKANRMPTALERLSIVEIQEDRVQRLRNTLDKTFAKMSFATRLPGPWVYALTLNVPETPQPERSAPVSKELRRERPVEPAAPTAVVSTEKPHAFIAMPFDDTMDDVFYYGIQNPVHNSGLLCERVDKSAFTGDIMGYVRQRIETASVVIAELTGANPNVYLEVGYAWGKERPTILLVQSEKDLEFDVRGHRCLTYRKIKDLEQSLQKEIQGMITAGIIKL